MILKSRLRSQVLRIVCTALILLAVGPIAGPLVLANDDAATETPANDSQQADQVPRAITVATWNVEWFFDHYKGDNRSEISKKQSSPNAEEWAWKKKSVARVIAEIKPTILCLQEVENRDVVYQLRQQLESDHRLKYRYAFISGYDFSTEQDVAILYRAGLVEFSRREQSPEMYETKQYYNLSKHMFARFEWGQGEEKESLTIFNGHFRARAEQRDLRKRQALLARKWLEEKIAAGENVIATGDFNTEDDYGAETADGPVAIIRGTITESPADDLLDANQYLPEDGRSTHISGRQYDRVFYSRSLGEDDPDRKDLVFNRVIIRRDLVVQGTVDANHWDGLYDIPQSERDISDHYPLVTEFVFK